MIQTQHEMSPTQEHLLRMVLEIDRICKKHDIEYFIDYGTALGAIRHEGFIPWDDDLDIQLTEDNYYKWVEACKEELDGVTRCYNDNHLDREAPTVFGRYIDLTSFRVGNTMEFWKPLCGQCIDVFYLIPLPGDPVKKQEMIDYYFAYDEFSNSSFRHVSQRNEAQMKLYRKWTKQAEKVGKEKVLRSIEKNIFHKHYDDCDTYICASARKSGPTSIVPKSCYDSVYMADFEGHKLPVPGKYVELLNHYYEDTWMILPDEKKQHSHESGTGICAEAYYDDYIRILGDKNELLSDRQKFKNLSVEEGYRLTGWSKDVFEKVGQYELLKINRRLKQDKIKLKDLMVAEDRDKALEICDIFEEYLEKQMDKAVRYYEFYMDIGEEKLTALIFGLIYGKEDFYTVAKLLELYQKAGNTLTDKMKDLWNIVLMSRQIKAETLYGHTDRATELVTEARKQYPYVRDLCLCELTLMVTKADSAEDYDKCESRAKELMNGYEEDDHCMKALGDIEMKRGNKDRAMEYYQPVLDKTRNGMLSLQIEKTLRR